MNTFRYRCNSRLLFTPDFVRMLKLENQDPRDKTHKYCHIFQPLQNLAAVSSFSALQTLSPQMSILKVYNFVIFNPNIEFGFRSW